MASGRAVEEGLGVHELAERRGSSDSSPWATLLHWVSRAGGGLQQPIIVPALSPAASASQATADLFAED